MNAVRHCTAFQQGRRIASGPALEVAIAAQGVARGSEHPVLIFDDRSGRSVDFDLRGSAEDVAARFAAEATRPARGPGRPKLGVVAREVTLLPRHWDWLANQPGGPSATLRRLVDAARATDPGAKARRQAQEAADNFMRAMLGDQPGYEEAARSLYAGQAERFQALTQSWPADLRDHARHLAAPAFEKP